LAVFFWPAIGCKAGASEKMSVNPRIYASILFATLRKRQEAFFQD